MGVEVPLKSIESVTGTRTTIDIKTLSFNADNGVIAVTYEVGGGTAPIREEFALGSFINLTNNEKNALKNLAVSLIKNKGENI